MFPLYYLTLVLVLYSTIALEISRTIVLWMVFHNLGSPAYGRACVWFVTYCYMTGDLIRLCLTGI